jgi:sodium-dependent phosphate transporter
VLLTGGAGAVHWNARIDEFPYFAGVSAIVASWRARARAGALSRVPDRDRCKKGGSAPPALSLDPPPKIRRFTSPLFACIGAAAIFGLERFMVLRRPDSLRRSFALMPAALLLTLFINLFFVLSKGAGKMLLSSAGSSWCADAACKRVSSGQAAWVAAAAAAVGAALGSSILIPLQRRRIARKADCAAADPADAPASDM